MRFPKGSLQLNESYDYSLLRRVLHCEFVSTNQLYEFMKLSHQQELRHTFNWRLRRLVGHGFLVRRAIPGVAMGQFVYSIGVSGAALLQGAGEYCLIAPSRRDAGDQGMSVLHSLELNEIHLTLLRSGLSARWIPTTEIRSQNELTSFGYAKVYDAVIEVTVDGTTLKFALEYERTPKAKEDYRRIAGDVAGEKHLRNLLYLMPNHDLLHYVLPFFDQPIPRTYFGIVREWHSKHLEMPVLDATCQRKPSLCQALVSEPSARLA